MVEEKQLDKASQFETMLIAERPRIVRLCARLSGRTEAAEDLAQEVLVKAWEHAHQLMAPEGSAPWLSGIARNVCLNWSRSYYREQSRLHQPTNAPAENPVDNLEDSFNLEVELDRQELALLLDRALAILPGDTRAAVGLRESLEIAAKDISFACVVPVCLAQLATVASIQGEAERAARLFAVAEALQEPVGFRFYPAIRSEFDRDVAATRVGVDKETWRKAWQEGRAMTLEEAISYALDEEIGEVFSREN